MGRLYGQKIPLTSLSHALKRGELPHAILLHGPEHSGKYESSINLAKAIHCREKNHRFCDRCPSCVSIHLHRSEHLLALSNDDRIFFIRFFLHLLKNNLTHRKKTIRYALLADMANVLNRHKYGFFEALQTEKKSFSQGVKLSSKQREETLAYCYTWFNHLTEGRPIEDLDTALVEEHFRRAQNSLDRTLISKKTFENLSERLHRDVSRQRIVIIQHIHLINHAVIGSLLKLLEDPPDRHFFILTARELSELPPMVIDPLRSRCFELAYQTLRPENLHRIFSQKYGIEKFSSDQVEYDLASTALLYMSDSQTVPDARFFLNLLQEGSRNVISLHKYVKEKAIGLPQIIRIYRQEAIERIRNEGERKRGLNLTEEQIREIERALNRADRHKTHAHLKEEHLILRLLSEIALSVERKRKRSSIYAT